MRAAMACPSAAFSSDGEELAAVTLGVRRLAGGDEGEAGGEIGPLGRQPRVERPVGVAERGARHVLLAGHGRQHLARDLVVIEVERRRRRVGDDGGDGERAPLGRLGGLGVHALGEEGEEGECHGRQRGEEEQTQAKLP